MAPARQRRRNVAPSSTWQCSSPMATHLSGADTTFLKPLAAKLLPPHELESCTSVALRGMGFRVAAASALLPAQQRAASWVTNTATTSGSAFVSPVHDPSPMAWLAHGMGRRVDQPKIESTFYWSAGRCAYISTATTISNRMPTTTAAVIPFALLLIGGSNSKSS